MKKIIFLILMGIAATQATFTAHADSNWTNKIKERLSEKRDDTQDEGEQKDSKIWKKRLAETTKRYMKGHHKGNTSPAQIKEKAKEIATAIKEDPEMKERLENRIEKMIQKILEEKDRKYRARMNKKVGAKYPYDTQCLV